MEKIERGLKRHLDDGGDSFDSGILGRSQISRIPFQIGSIWYRKTVKARQAEGYRNILDVAGTSDTQITIGRSLQSIKTSKA